MYIAKGVMEMMTRDNVINGDLIGHLGRVSLANKLTI